MKITRLVRFSVPLICCIMVAILTVIWTSGSKPTHHPILWYVMAGILLSFLCYTLLHASKGIRDAEPEVMVFFDSFIPVASIFLVACLMDQDTYAHVWQNGIITMYFFASIVGLISNTIFLIAFYKKGRLKISRD